MVCATAAAAAAARSRRDEYGDGSLCGGGSLPLNLNGCGRFQTCVTCEIQIGKIWKQRLAEGLSDLRMEGRRGSECIDGL